MTTTLPAELEALRPVPILISSISTPRQAQAREQMSRETAEDYAAAIRAGVQLPPIVVYEEPGDGAVRRWLADGWHRCEGAQLAGETLVLAEVRPGTLRDAVLWAAGANAGHGLRRTRADKRRAVLLLLADPEWSTWSDRAIADRCRVHHELVGTLRRERAQEVGGEVPTQRRGADGRTIETRAIGQRPNPMPQVAQQPEPEPASEADKDRDPLPAIPPDREQEIAGLQARIAALKPTREELRVALADVRPADVRAAVKTERRELDAYYTPDHVAEACVRALQHLRYLPLRPDTRILEPHVGGGAWVRALRRLQVPGEIHVLDIDPKAEGLASEGVASARAVDFLEDRGRVTVNPYDVVVGNPPYGADCEAHVRRGLEVVRLGGVVAYLLRRNFLGPARRELVAEGLAPCDELVIEPRISFQADGATDGEEYSLFVWRRGPRAPRVTWRTQLLRAARPEGRRAG